MKDRKIPARWSALSIAVLATGAAWMWFTGTLPASTTGGRIRGIQPGYIAPDFSLHTLDGNIITLSELRGQPVLVNVWASWCKPCIYEMPTIQRVYEEFRDRGFVVLAVNLTEKDSLNSIIPFVEEHGLTFPILLDPEGQVADAYQLRGLPTSFFIARDGVIQSVVIGGPMPEALLRTRVERLIEEP